MSVDEFNKRTKKLCLSRRNLFKGTPFEQLYNRYLDHRSLLPIRPNCCSEVCPGCYRSLSHADRMYRLKSVKRNRNKIETDQVVETFTCRHCKVRVSARTTIPKAPLQGFQSPKAKKTPASPADIFNLSTNSTPGGSSKRSRNKKKKRELVKEICVQQASSIKQRRQGGRSSLNDFLDLL